MPGRSNGTSVCEEPTAATPSSSFAPHGTFDRVEKRIAGSADICWRAGGCIKPPGDRHVVCTAYECVSTSGQTTGGRMDDHDRTWW